MARIIYPEDFPSQRLLFDTVKAKNDSLPPAINPLTAFLTQHEISFPDDEAAKVAAIDFETERSEKSHMAENRTQQRDLKFNPVFAYVRDYYQFLKKFYTPNYMQIGEWGAPITVSGRIAYPNEFAERVTIFKALKTKYDTYLPPGTSPLDPYLNLHQLSIPDNNTDVDAADQLNKDAKSLAKKAEDSTEERNNVWNPVMAHMRSIGGFLMSLYSTNPKEVGEWGFTVNDSPRAPKEVVSKVKLGSQLTVRSLIIGGTFKNIGPVPLMVYKGDGPAGPSVTVLPNELYGITKGYSTITVVNPSNTTTGVFSALRNK